MTDRLRRAASVLLIRGEPIEVLMIKRHGNATFGSSFVFPGGVVDPDDASEAWLPYLVGADSLSVEERSSRIAACRETFEETAILLAEKRDGAPFEVALPDPIVPFRELIIQRGTILDLSALIPFARWITPQLVAKRFDIRFYLAQAPISQAAKFDGIEVTDVEWLEPSKCAAEGVAGRRVLFFPTLANLERLAEAGTFKAAAAYARHTPIAFVTPRVEDRAGAAVVTLPRESGYSRLEFPFRAP